MYKDCLILIQFLVYGCPNFFDKMEEARVCKKCDFVYRFDKKWKALDTLLVNDSGTVIGLLPGLTREAFDWFQQAWYARNTSLVSLC